MNSSRLSLSNYTNASLLNNLGIMNFSQDCEKKLKSFYNIPNDLELIFSQTDINNQLNLNDSNTSNKFSFKVFNPTNYSELNLEICQEIDIKLSLPEIGILYEYNMTEYNEFKNNGVNLSSTKDPFFSDRCQDFNQLISKITGNDYFYSLNSRIINFFKSSSPQCSNGKNKCDLTSGLFSGYIDCNCQINDNSQISIKIVSNFEKVIINSNYDIILCYQYFINFEFSNLGFLILTPLYLIFWSLSIYNYCRKKRFIKYQEELYYYDSFITNQFKNQFEIEKSKIESSKNQSKSKKIIMNDHISSFFSLKVNKNLTVTKEKPKIWIKFNCHQNFVPNFKELENEKNKLSQKISLQDLKNMSVKAELKHDNRSFFEYFKDTLITKNPIGQTFFLKSLLDPSFIRVIRFNNLIALDLFIICFLFNEDSISNPEKYSLKSDLSNNNISIILSTLWGIILSGFVKILMYYCTYVPIDYKIDYNYYLRYYKNEKFNEIYDIFLSKMKLRYTIFVIFSVLFNFYFYYFIIIFFRIYSSYWGLYIVKFFTTLFFQIIVMGIFLPLFLSLIRLLSKKYHKLMNIYYLKFII